MLVFVIKMLGCIVFLNLIALLILWLLKILYLFTPILTYEALLLLILGVFQILSSYIYREDNIPYGWGTRIYIQTVDFENGAGKIIVVNSFETVTHRSNQPCCHFLRGFLAGFLSELFAKEIGVDEERCAGKGDEQKRKKPTSPFSTAVRYTKGLKPTP